MGVTNAELWNNLGLCCFYASQYDMCLGCFDRALQLADDSGLADVWYNIGQVSSGFLSWRMLKGFRADGWMQHCVGAMKQNVWYNIGQASSGVSLLGVAGSTSLAP